MTRYAGTADPRLPGAGQGDHEAGAPASAAARFIDLVEAVEDVRQFGLGDSRAGIRDAEEHVTTAFGGTDDDLAAPRRVVQGIVLQFGQYLNCPVGGGLDRRRGGG